MFERFVRLAEAQGALRQGRYEQALKLVRDPSIASHRRARDLRDKALAGLMSRARRRHGDGGLSAALADVSRILAVEPEYAGARALQVELKATVESAKAADATARRMLVEARQLAEAGDLTEALEICESAAELARTPAEATALRQLIATRRAAAVRFLEEAAQALRGGLGSEARDLLSKARAQDRRVEGAEPLGRKVAIAVADGLLPRLRKMQADGDDAAAWGLFAAERSQLPELADVPALREFAAANATSRTARVRQLVDGGELEEAVELCRDLEFGEASPELAALRAAIDELARGLDLRDCGDFAGAVECLERAQSRLPAKGIERAAKHLRAEGKTAEAALASARELGAAGRLVEARQVLLPVLERWPMHESVRAEMETLDRGALEQGQRLQRARELAREGKLREASAQALSLAVPGTPGDEARLLLQEIQTRSDLVQRGLDQVRRAVHGRHSGSADGLRHCVLRLDQLMAVQSDHEELGALKAAIEAELAGIALLELAEAAIERDRPKLVAEHLAELVADSKRLLRPERLHARRLETADRIAKRCDAALAGGRLSQARQWAHCLAALSADHADVATRAARLTETIDAHQREAAAAAARGEQALASRDLDTAQSCLDEARTRWSDGPPVIRLETSLHAVRKQEVALEEVEALTMKRDYTAAHERLEDLPPTPAVLRTRIFDIKQGLARAQGLDGGFILRVDEGGEFLVLRGDTVTVGNVRESRADLCVLANIAGHHATICRSMSFHGGQQDRIRAEKGPIRVNGEAVTDHKLRSGDRVKLGPSLELTYRLPSTRSLTALLTLSSGFQVAGTDKVMLMRDRGRDGRILIGASADAHVRVPRSQAEVELFAAKDGQVRVCFDGAGTMDGKPFRGEHPVTAGAVITCGPVSLVLQPWSGGF